MHICIIIIILYNEAGTNQHASWSVVMRGRGGGFVPYRMICVYDVRTHTVYENVHH